MTARYHTPDKKVRAVRRDIALRRPELRQDYDFGRASSAGAVSPPVKVIDAATRRLIDDAVARRAH